MGGGDWPQERAGGARTEARAARPGGAGGPAPVNHGRPARAAVLGGGRLGDAHLEHGKDDVHGAAKVVDAVEAALRP